MLAPPGEQIRRCGIHITFRWNMSRLRNRTPRVSDLQWCIILRTLLVTNPHGLISKPTYEEQFNKKLRAIYLMIVQPCWSSSCLAPRRATACPWPSWACWGPSAPPPTRSSASRASASARSWRTETRSPRSTSWWPPPVDQLSCYVVNNRNITSWLM